MGINCSNCMNNKIPTNKDIKIDIDSPLILNSITKIQSIFRSYIFRKKNNLLHYDSYNLIYQFPNKKNKLNGRNNYPYKILQKSNISIEQINNLNKLFPPLTDNIKLTFIKLLYPNNSEYSGEFNPILKERHGRGIQLWTDNTIYSGYWKNDKISGKGKLIHPSGDYYEGEFLDDCVNGFGTYISKKGGQYVGMWKNNLQDGKGKLTWSDKTEYNGEWKKGKKWGKGKFIMSDGSYFEGDFYQNCMHGKGKFQWNDNKIYIGEWKNNKMDGEGEFFWPDGKVYKGHYFQDEKNGFGELTFPNGRIYKGYWKNGLQHGEGEIYSPKEKIWKKGLWNEGKRVRWSVNEIGSDRKNDE